MRTLPLVFALLILPSPADASGCIMGNCYSGHGHYVWDDGTEYVGNWGNDKFHGKGTYTYRPGLRSKRYSGNWYYGVMSGKGVLEYTDGRTYTGSFEENKLTGMGVMKDSAGVTTEAGYWKEGFLVASESEMKEQEQRLNNLRRDNSKNSRIINAIKFARQGDSADFHSESVPINSQKYAFADCVYYEWREPKEYQDDGLLWNVRIFDLNMVNWKSLRRESSQYADRIRASCEGECTIEKKYYVVDLSEYSSISFKPMANVGRTYNAINDIKAQCPGYSSPY